MRPGALQIEHAGLPKSGAVAYFGWVVVDDRLVNAADNDIGLFRRVFRNTFGDGENNAVRS